MTWEAALESQERERQARVLEAVELQQVQDEVLEVHGVLPGKKPAGVITRLLYENANGIDGRFSNNGKLEKARRSMTD